MNSHSRCCCSMTLWIEAIVAVACSYVVALCMWPILVRLPERWVGAVSVVGTALGALCGFGRWAESGFSRSQFCRLWVAIFACAIAVLCFLYLARAQRHGDSAITPGSSSWGW